MQSGHTHVNNGLHPENLATIHVTWSIYLASENFRELQVLVDLWYPTVERWGLSREQQHPYTHEYVHRWPLLSTPVCDGKGNKTARINLEILGTLYFMWYPHSKGHWESHIINRSLTLPALYQSLNSPCKYHGAPKLMQQVQRLSTPACHGVRGCLV